LSAPRPTAELEDVPPSATRGRTKLLWQETHLT
jgi:hypothetical protein